MTMLESMVIAVFGVKVVRSVLQCFRDPAVRALVRMTKNHGRMLRKEMISLEDDSLYNTFSGLQRPIDGIEMLSCYGGGALLLLGSMAYAVAIVGANTITGVLALSAIVMLLFITSALFIRRGNQLYKKLKR